ncbi:CBS domain-containing protein [Ktedonosporobacter rubrisoli]|uniref:CBS domain-containing protein n=1 Tax=Ktedonosporobacter rubrisoli TaxID=2509675 RepID=A0A4P6JTP3_KTERU|nr:chloride channel protein [Ktedonosporobacter rubrisoli]QBD78693.1 CBS domain-containing protein [Ktedonosporobacter rubrisoli]
MKAGLFIPFLRRLFHIRRTKRSFESPRYLLKWLLISTLIGLVAGIGAIVFYVSIHLATVTFLGQLVGYLPPSPAGEGASGVMSLWSAARPWLLPVITTAGGLLAGIIVFTLAPEAEGHGTDAAIKAFHQGLPIRARIPIIKLVASAITIGTGGSAGREGPTAQISAGFGSLLASILRLDLQDRRIAIATGIGAGIGAIFRAPLGGAILAAEILYKNDLEIEAIIPALIASIVGYSVFGAWMGWTPIFAVSENLAFTSPPQLLYYILLGIICGLVGVLYARGFYGITHIFQRLRLPNWIKPAIGGLLVGLIALVIPQALGMGYGWVQLSMGKGLLSLPLWIILLLPFAKIITTGLTVGSGGSGGIFGPGMVIGGMLGATVWRLCYHVLPGLPATPGPFVIVGMMALFGGIAHAPLAVMLMVAEMTGNLSMLAPAMIAVGISSIIVGHNTIYTSQLSTRADSPAHRLQLSFPLLSTLAVGKAMSSLTLHFAPQQSVAEAEQILADRLESGAPVLDPAGELQGVLTLLDIQRVPPEERSQRLVSEAMNRDVLVVYPEETLDEALEQLTSKRISWAPVVDAEASSGHMPVVGILSAADIVRTYRKTLARDSRRMRGLVEGTVMLEVTIEDGMPIAGRPLREAHLPRECLVVSIRRSDELLFPRGSAFIKPGDVVTFLVSPQGEDSLQQYLQNQQQAADHLLA